MALDYLEISPDRRQEAEEGLISGIAAARNAFFDAIGPIENISPPGADAIRVVGDGQRETYIADIIEMERLRDEYVANRLREKLGNELLSSGSQAGGRRLRRADVIDVVDRMMGWPADMGFVPFSGRAEAEAMFDEVWNELDDTLSIN